MSLRCYLGHGASGTAASMKPFVDGLRKRGIDATAIDLPKRKAEEAIPAFHLVVPSEADVAVGGHSFGGRVASLAAAEPDAPYAALVLFSYPLHPPGKPDKLRTEHLPDLQVPCLFVSGTKDPFGTPEEIEAATATIPGSVTHVWIENGRHDLRGKDPVVVDAVQDWLAGLATS
jgi:predicted alpha/beta-hydrolase family hydrolase